MSFESVTRSAQDPEDGNESMEIEKQDRLKQSEIHDKRQVGIAAAPQLSPTQSGGTKMAENTDVSQGFAESMDRAQSAGRKMSETTSGMFENWSDMYGTLFSLNGGSHNGR